MSIALASTVPSQPTVVFPNGPVAGSNFLLIPIPATEWWQVGHVFVRLICDANVSNRQLSISLHDTGGVGRFVTSDNNNHVAGSNDVITAMPGAGFAGIVSLSHYVAPLPSPLWVPAGWFIGLLLFGVQPGDVMTDIAITRQRYRV
jgi:hypothetical protein